ncbi:MAG: ABC transporter ATP-binding protein [Treponemataceae bacterium]|nr:ABC transporter ATP-binding protein [Treponemataceae bacterium]
MALIELKDIKKIYQMGAIQVEALKDINLSIEKGEFLTISGPSGSGKSTILNILGLIDMPNAGKVFINGNPVFTDEDQKYYIKNGKISREADSRICRIRKNNVGIIFQSFNLFPVLNVYQNIEYPFHLGIENIRGMKKKEQKEWIMYLINRVGLEKWVTHRPNELSGGQRQRVAIARALATKAPIILADEPTANLDTETGNQILQLMKEINKEFETTFIFSTHDQKIVDLADRVVKILDGKIISN